MNLGRNKMPLTVVKSYASKSGKSEKEIEDLWKDTESVVRKTYPKIDDKSDNFYKIVNAVVQKRLKIENVQASTTTTDANVGDGQSGQYAQRMNVGVDDKYKKSLKAIMDYINKLSS